MPATPRHHRRRPLILAVLAAVAVGGLSADDALGQYRQNENGGALDANQRLGSGGSNTVDNPVNAGQYGGYGAYNNNVVTGNVTGGRQFRGSVGYTDPRAFRDGTGGAEFDAFNRSASGVTTGGRLINYADAGSSQTYFGDNTVANPPANFVRTPGTGGYVPPRNTGLTADLTTAADLRVTSNYATRTANPDGSRVDSPLARLFTGGALDATTTVNSAGVANSDRAAEANRRQLLGSPEALVLGNRLTAGGSGLSLADLGGRSLSPYTRLGRDDRLGELTGDRLRALGGELLRDEQGQPASPDAVQTLLAPGSAGLDATAPAEGGLEQIERGVNRGGRNDPVLRLADPAEQSAQYAQLQRRLDRFRSDPLGENVRRQGAEPADPDGGVLLPGFDRLPGLDAPQDGGEAAPAPVPAPAAEPVGDAAIVPSDPPVLVESFAAGVASPTLKDVLADAERLLGEGQYVNAVARYEAASRLVPNQPLVVLGRGTAELAAGYYRRAAGTLRESLQNHPELAMGRVGVGDLIGGERVAELSEDLRQLAEEKPDSDVPVFLLAFLSYGAEDYARAGNLLDEAARRSGDPFYANVRQLWLPGTAEPQATEPEAPLPEVLPGELSK